MFTKPIRAIRKEKKDFFLPTERNLRLHFRPENKVVTQGQLSVFRKFRECEHGTKHYKLLLNFNGSGHVFIFDIKNLNTITIFPQHH